MNIIECSREKPWGIHPALRQDQCPRCGWAAPPPPALQPVQPAWTVIEGGLEAAA